jgi:hypothetical protein
LPDSRAEARVKRPNFPARSGVREVGWEPGLPLDAWRAVLLGTLPFGP